MIALLYLLMALKLFVCPGRMNSMCVRPSMLSFLVGDNRIELPQ